MSVGELGQIWAKVGKGGQIWMGNTDWRGMDDISIRGVVCACRFRGGCEWVWASLGRYAREGKDVQVWMGQTDWVGMSEMAGRWVWVCVKV